MINVNAIYYKFFQLPFDQNMSKIICADCCNNLIKGYNFRDYFCGWFEYDEETSECCQICCSNSENSQILSNIVFVIINGKRYKIENILKELCSYEINVNIMFLIIVHIFIGRFICHYSISG